MNVEKKLSEEWESSKRGNIKNKFRTGDMLADDILLGKKEAVMY